MADPVGAEKPKRSKARALWTALGALGVLLFCAAFLLLTGIIGEPETFIENILKALAGS